ncbi:MAG: TlpA disulfide reductase family protein [Spirochaetales bacterium]|jgi:peroxiredoxin|nr:TlpA disulfide reductase family protein [Spirochaetales bacterium]
MKRTTSYFLTAFAIFAVILTPCVLAATSPPPTGGVLPEITLSVPEVQAYRNYLGLSRGNFFKVPEIKGNVVIIEVFSMYCPFCQMEAPNVNSLYRAIESDENLKGKIKLIGIGAGNSSFEIEDFRDTYNIPFPLFPDEDFSIHKSLGDVRTPYFIGVKINEDGTHKVFYSNLGGFDKVETFLQMMLKLSELK